MNAYELRFACVQQATKILETQISNMSYQIFKPTLFDLARDIETFMSTKPEEKLQEIETKIIFNDEELINCIRDPIYFAKNHVKVQDPVKGQIKFKPYPFQENLIKHMHENDHTINMIPRQQGKTLCAIIYLLWKALYTPNQTIVIGVNKIASILNILTMLRSIYDEIPDNLKPKIPVFNKNAMNFENGSRIIARAVTMDCLRGLSIDCLYIDEMAFFNNATIREFWTSVQPVLSLKGKCIISSTSNKGSLFNELFDDDNFIFKKFKTKWSDNPSFDAEWAKQMKYQIGEERFNEQFE